MRGNWDTAEALAFAPDQHQRQTIVEEEHPLRSPTTPAWGINDTIVHNKEEAEEKNNDSGVSPGHYSNSMSPRSHQSSTIDNCSLSPGSATSHDSSNLNAMQCTTFNFPEPNVFQSFDFTRHLPTEKESLERFHINLSPDALRTQSNDAESLNDNILRCPLCIFVTQDRVQFGEHLAYHCASKPETPDFAKQMMSQLSPPSSIQADESINSREDMCMDEQMEELDEPGLRVPHVNSQGKVKTFRCKQCSFVAITKEVFWEHRAQHIRVEKRMPCPFKTCRFVTEFKHHLEYHMRNHIKSKPFKCDKCNYSCVNRSMLTSHQKSHSNIYPFRCANCTFATKYCHMLKQHLRKNNHHPAMVLNSDGSPNPLPIIDVWGTRRGPKQKPMKSVDDSPSEHHGPMPPLTPLMMPSPMAIPGQLSPVSNNVFPISQFENGLGNGLPPMMPPNSSGMMGFQYPPMFPPFPINSHHQFMMQEEPDKHGVGPHLKSSPVAMDLVKTSAPEKILDEGKELPRFSPQQTRAVNLEKSPEDNRATPLDLSKPDVAKATSPKTPKSTSRRKGRAVKLEQQVVVAEDSEDERSMELDVLDARIGQRVEETKKDSEKPNLKVGMNNEFTCNYCQISFGNDVMYTVHMGYHGYKDPYTCNMCGQECSDNVSFFLHIGKSKHS